MSNGFGAPARLHPRSSPALTAGLAAGHALAAGAALAAPLPLVLRLTVCALLCASLARGLAVHALRRAPAAVTGLQVDPSGTLWVRCRAGAGWRRAGIRQAVVFRSLIVLRLSGGGARGVVLAADSADHDDFRRFRAALRMRSWVEPE